MCFHPLQAANCCRNSRLVVHEDDFNRVTLVKNISFLLKQFYENCSPETPRCNKLSHFSVLQNDALMHREGSKG